MRACIRALFLFTLAVAGCAGDATPVAGDSEALHARGCWGDSSRCPRGQLCFNSRNFCGIQPACGEFGGGVQCGCHCGPCSADSCAPDEVCGAGGCCEPRPCRNSHDCGVKGDHCIGGLCVEPGFCSLPPV